MKLIIDIDEELYEAYKGKPPMLGDAGMDMIAQAIANGKPLPKGYGELIDKEVVLDMMNHGILEDYITDMVGVIPADKG